MNKRLINAGVLVCCMLFVAAAGADEGKDVFAGLLPDIKETVNGAGKYIVYIVELFMASIVYIKSRNITAFAGVGILAIFFNFVMGSVVA